MPGEDNKAMKNEDKKAFPFYFIKEIDISLFELYPKKGSSTSTTLFVKLFWRKY